MKKEIKVRSDEEALKLFGTIDEHITFAEKTYKVRIWSRGHRVSVSGPEECVEEALAFLKGLLAHIRRGVAITDEVRDLCAHREIRREIRTPQSLDKGTMTTYKGKVVAPRSEGQQNYLDLAETNDIIFAIGPAGTGKTYLAVAIALQFLKEKRVQRIVLTRPAVEAGESLGFLPGDMYAKINPYLRPLYDALYEMIGFDEVARHIERGIIEIAPLAYMRGRTLNDAFIILDEAQNATPQQMKMFLTRLGFSSKCIVTGDITQIDLPHHTKSGLVHVQQVLPHIKGISFVYLTEEDVVRHALVKDIVAAYEKEDKRRQKK